MSIASKLFAIILILASLIGGFLMEGGRLASLWHPSELIIILGIGLGAFLAATPVRVWGRTLMFLGRFFAGERINRALYQEVQEMLNTISRFTRSEGMLALDAHLENYENSPLFTNYPNVMAHAALRDFIIRNFAYMILNPPKTESIGEQMAVQIERYIDELREVPRATGKLSDWLPGFGIIAAVMGVILAMGLLGGDMDVAKIGEAIGAALVGTLLGVFFAFAVVSPFTHAVEVMIREEQALFEMVAAMIEAHYNGVSPKILSEIGLQMMPPHYLPEREA